MDSVFAIYVMAAVVFALPAYIACVFAYCAVAGIVAAVRTVVAHFAAKTVEIVTPIQTVAIPEGMTFEEFDAWLSNDPFKGA